MIAASGAPSSNLQFGFLVVSRMSCYYLDVTVSMFVCHDEVFFIKNGPQYHHNSNRNTLSASFIRTFCGARKQFQLNY